MHMLVCSRQGMKTLFVAEHFTTNPMSLKLDEILNFKTREFFFSDAFTHAVIKVPYI
jgi:hypothetical protein